MSTGSILAEQTLSPSILNSRINFIGTGAEINGLAPTVAGMEAHCTADYLNLFKKDHVYIRDSLNQRWIPTIGFRHLHDDDTDEAGGNLADVMIANLARAYILSMPCPTWEQFITDHGGAGIAHDYEDGMGLDLSGTLGDFVNATIRGAEIWVAKDFVWGARLSVDSGSQMSIKAGVGMEKIQNADDPLSKAGLEACDTSGTARNWSFTTANGSGRDSIGTSVSVSEQYYYRGNTVYVDSGNVARFVFQGAISIPALSKTTNVPSAGSTEIDNVLRLGYKNNSTSAKSMFIAGLFLYGSIGVQL